MTRRALSQTVAFGVLITLGVLGYILWSGEEPAPPTRVPETPVTPSKVPWPSRATIGTSVEGRSIDAYTYGTGTVHLLFVGGIHGGYEWNSILLAYTVIDYLTEHPETVPTGLRVTVIPNVNPDGLFEGTGSEGRFAAASVPTGLAPGTGRLNAHKVDINRNFACKWKPGATWRSTSVSAGTAPFSEPEAQALKVLIENEKPAAVIFWHSKSNAVYASECEAGILPATRTLMNTYAQASGYLPVDSFTAYAVTGDAEGWLASIGIPAITVELSTHETIEWEKNLAGIQALFTLYGD